MPKSQPKTLLVEGHASEARILELQLTLAGVMSVVKKGEYARMEATDNDPLNAAGTDAYRYRVRGLRDTFCPTGKWRKQVDGGLEKLQSVDGRRCIITRAGDEGVGNARICPQPKQEVGGTTVRAAKANATLALDPNWFNVDPPSPKQPELVETWMLMVHREGDIVRSELSRFSKLDGDGRALGWIERILLPELNLSNTSLASAEDPQDATPAEIDVPVARKR